MARFDVLRLIPSGTAKTRSHSPLIFTVAGQTDTYCCAMGINLVSVGSQQLHLVG